ncbi:unnamed protein product [Phytomonas sp. Hart1]|nr:unnamed protein product [Phytomonas sp. Hart1]|eukprot:CCW68595.1 unnamed protein product [Phytomonas sp. isolate Hart1]
MLAPRGTAVAQESDIVLVFHNYLNLTPLKLKAGDILHCKEGKFAHNDIIGKPLGTYIQGLSNIKDDPITPSILVLQNSADLWTQAVPHRTQIIYDTDIAVIVFKLNLGPNKRVAEAGTGSGSLTHSLARAVFPKGVVFTYDFHKDRCLEARREFRGNGIGPKLVSSHWRDVCAVNTGVPDIDPDQVDEEVDVANMIKPLCGFGLPRCSVDAVFLDVPAPWESIENVRHILKPNGMLCTFSPCIEQTQHTASKLRESPQEFVDVHTVEALTKYFEPVYKRAREAGDRDGLRFRPALVSKGHSAYLTFARRRLEPLGGDNSLALENGNECKDGNKSPVDVLEKD